MKLNLFEVVLINEDAVYLSGQTVQGHVILELAKSTNIKDLRMTFHGKAYVHWTEPTMRGPGEIRFKEIQHYSATEEYFEVSKSLLSHASGPAHNSEKRLLAAGQYTYPFQFQIPLSSPTSFEGQFGFIRYWVKVIIERPWKKNVAVKRLFTVICPMDLNREPSTSQPTQNKKEKRLCCLCCTSGPVAAELRVAQKGYVPGESVCINAEIDNHSRRKMANTVIELLMTTIFHTPIKSRSVTHQVARLEHGSLASGRSDSWEGDQLRLPPLPPSFLQGCNIIDVRYTLELRVFPHGPAFELTVPLEIIIGTIPLSSSLENYLTMHQMNEAAVREESGVIGGASESTNDYRLPQYVFTVPSTCAPSPLYHDQMHDDKDDQCSMLDDNFTPKYITFNFYAVPIRRNQSVAFAT